MGQRITLADPEVGTGGPDRMAFRWRADDGPFTVIFGSSKRNQSWMPSDPRMHKIPTGTGNHLTIIFVTLEK